MSGTQTAARAYAKANRHPEVTDQMIWPAIEAERSKLVPISSRFGGFRATPAADLTLLIGSSLDFG